MIEVTSSFKLHLPGVLEVEEDKMENLPSLESLVPPLPIMGNSTPRFKVSAVALVLRVTYVHPSRLLSLDNHTCGLS